MAIIDKPSDYFNTKLTTGTGNSQAVTGLGFQPDWIWGKRRDDTGNNSLFDSVRGITKGLESNGQGAEFTSSDYYTAFGNDGFTIAAGSGGAGNGNGQTAVQWCWKAGGSASSNSNGSITSSVSANTDAGFSIVSYTGNGSDNATIGHGLGSSINFVIVKRRNSTSNWLVQGSKVGTGYGQYLELNATSAVTSASDNIKSVSSSLLTLGTNGSCNGSSDTYIAYCFSEVSNYSKMESYTGNGNADGPFVYTGFKPAFLLVKRSSQANNDWNLHDNKSPGFNVNNSYLAPNSATAEVTGNTSQIFDLLSNGFKCRGAGTGSNASGSTYIYMAFAENPFVASNFVPTTAR
jgi:hypothetical protein